MLSKIPFALLSLIFAGWTCVSASAARVCNNSPDLCSKPYDTITYLGAHDSAFIRDASSKFSSFGNQFFNTTTQLDAGVRLLSAQVHAATNGKGQKEWHLCHTDCSFFDVGRLRDWFWEIRIWMDKHPNDVVTILLVNGDNMNAGDLREEYSAADIAHYGYIPPNPKKAPAPSNQTSQTWPSLNQMIDKNQRLVSFIAPITPDPENAPYLLNEWDFVWENNYMISDSSNFTCAPDRPAGLKLNTALSSGRLFLMNHFLYWDQAFGIQVPDIRNVNATNGVEGGGSLGAHILECSQQYKKQPTFVLVDFFNVGPAVRAVDIFNQVQNSVGRVAVTERVVGGGSGVQEGLSSAGQVVIPMERMLGAVALVSAALRLF